MRWRCYKHVRNAHLGALVEARWAAIDTVIEVYDARTAKMLGQYRREPAQGTHSLDFPCPCIAGASEYRLAEADNWEMSMEYELLGDYGDFYRASRPVAYLADEGRVLIHSADEGITAFPAEHVPDPVSLPGRTGQWIVL